MKELKDQEVDIKKFCIEQAQLKTSNPSELEQCAKILYDFFVKE
jgi:hypothetical protein